MNPIAALAFLCCMQMPAVAGPITSWTSPVGHWKTFDDRTGKARAIVQIYLEGNVFFARIVRTFTAEPDTRVCVPCTDDRKNQPVIGLVIMRGVKWEEGEYRGGTILDPESGAIYRCRFHLEQHGTRLTVRGFIGISLLGRSQTWLRESD